MAVIEGKKVKIFALSSNPELAEEISKVSGIPLSKVDIGRFSDGEISLNISESVRGNDVFVIQSTSSPVNENIMELLILSDALKRASAKNVTLVIPYYGYSRQDRKAQSRQPISAKLIADLIQVAGANRVICIDLHAAQIQGFFNIPIDNFPASPYLASYFKKMRLSDIVVVSPDHGGVTRARKFASYFPNSSLAIIDKRRPKPNSCEVMNIIGDVKNKIAIIIDDIIDTAGTICAAADALIVEGALEVYAAATHGVLSGDAIKNINDSKIKSLVISNSIKITPEKMSPKITILPIGALLGRAILNIINDEPISQIFDNVVNEQ
ncbi:MAG: ribose-phosphate pyrophosphokinase [Acholeplasmatales bacterium]|jgi:ribose-phosphate pyrophosphokinase|nr:ribose-phosphate pyrophosphokinase [Acholeplasmatales bacterium]